MILNNFALSIGLTKEQLKNSNDKNIQHILKQIEKYTKENSRSLIIEDEQE